MRSISLWLLVLIGTNVTSGNLRAQAPDSDLGHHAAGNSQPNDLTEQTIYVPYSKLREVFEKEGRGVFLPYEKFQELWQRARENTRLDPEPKPPVDALLTEITSHAVVTGDVVQVTAIAKFEVLQTGWHEIPLRLADAAILEANLNGEPARIVRRKEGYILLVEKQETTAVVNELRIVYAKAYTKSSGQNNVSFQAPQAPVNRWRIQVPETGVKIHIQPWIAATETTLDENDETSSETVIHAFVGAARHVRIDWTSKTKGATGLSAMATVQAQQQVLVDEGVLRTTAQLTYTISRAEITQLEIDVPADQKVVNVFDSNVRQWDVITQKTIQRIVIQLFQPTRGQQKILLELERFSESLPNESVKIPWVRAVDAGRQYGSILVRIAPVLRAEIESRKGLFQFDAVELREPLAKSTYEFSYRYATVPYELILSVEKVKPHVRVEQLVEAFLQPKQLTMNLVAKYHVQRAGIFQFQVDLPNGFEVKTVRGHPMEGAEAAPVDTFRIEEQNPRQLIVNLSRKVLGQAGIFVELQKQLDDSNLIQPTGKKSQLPLSLPKVSNSSFERFSGNFVLYAPESLQANPLEEEGLQRISFDDAFVNLASSHTNRFPDTRPVLAYLYTNQPGSLVIAAQRRQPQILAGQLLVVTIEPGIVKYRAHFGFEILYSGVQSLRIDIPEEIDTNVHSETLRLRNFRMTPQPEDIAEGYVAWSFTGETELLGKQTLELAWHREIEKIGVGKSITVAIPELRPMEVDHTWGQVVIRKAETLDVRAGPNPTGLRPVDPQTDLLNGQVVKDAAWAFEFHNDWSLDIVATRYQLEEVKRTSIERAVLRMVVARNKQTSVQALYRMRTARQRLEIKLPANFDPQKGFNLNPLRINGKSVELERGSQGKYYVPLTDQNPEKPFLLELRYTRLGGYQKLDFPEFPNDPAVQKVYLCAYLPNELALLGSQGPWTSELAQSWQHFLGGQLPDHHRDRDKVAWVCEGIPLKLDPTRDFETDGQLYVFSTLRPEPPPDGSLSMTAMRDDLLTALVFLLVTVPGVVLVTRPLSQRLMAVGTLLIMLVFSSIFLPTFSTQIFDHVLLLGIILVLAVWFLIFSVQISRRRIALLAARCTHRAEVGSPTGNQNRPTESTELFLTPDDTGGGSPDLENSTLRDLSDTAEDAHDREKGGSDNA